MKTTLPALGALLVCALFATACDKPIDPAAPKPTTTLGTEIDDGIVSARVKAALLADPDVKGFDFQVDTRKGEVQLSGFVDNNAQIERALTLTRQTEGVKQVINSVSLKGSPASVGTVIDDSILTTRAKSALLADPEIKSFDISVVSRKGNVQLSGFVDNLQQVQRAAAVVLTVEGVKAVTNELSVKK